MILIPIHQPDRILKIPSRSETRVGAAEAAPSVLQGLKTVTPGWGTPWGKSKPFTEVEAAGWAGKEPALGV